MTNKYLSGLLGLAAFFWVGCGQPAQEDDLVGMAADSVRILAYNIHHGEGMDEVLDLERIAALILRVEPDVVTLQEVDSVTTRTGGIDQAAELGRLTGYAHAFSQFMPYQGGGYGMAVLSRLPIERVESLRLPDGEEPRTALAVTVTTPKSGRQLRVVGIHFYMTESERIAQAASTEEQLRLTTVPTILMGDFNSEPDSPVMGNLSQEWIIVDKGDDHMTFSSFDPVKEIDYALLSKGSGLKVVNQSLLDEPVMSDHRPYVIDVVLPAALKGVDSDVQ